MGIISTRDCLGPPFSGEESPVQALDQFDKELAIKASIIEAIKRRDSILFEKAMQHYKIRPLEIIGSAAQQKTLLHYAAEHNFYEGMTLALDYITQFHAHQMFKILNCKDAKGNTPLMACCQADAADALEVLMKYRLLIDQSIKNNMDKTALDIAYENQSPCLYQLDFQIQVPKFTPSHMAKSYSSPGSTRPSQVSTPTLVNSPNIRKVFQKIEHAKDKDDDSINSNVSTPTMKRHSALKSVATATKDKTDLASTAKLLATLTGLGEEYFNDPEFPHDISSIASGSCQEKIIEQFGIPRWKRPIKFMNDDLEGIKIFEDVELNDISNSLIGWCDLYSALAALAEYPQRLLKVFGTKEATKQGVYSLNFLVAGIKLEILLDDYFPCTERSRLFFSKPKNNELWFLLLEKAFAKLYGNYLEVKNVMIAEAFEIMTGMPSSQHPLREAREDDLWNTLLEYDQRNYIVCAGSYKNFPNKNRVFMVSGVYEVEQERIVKLKNHYNAVQWRGEFANGSKKWTKDMKEEVGHYEGEKNNFYMSMREFLKTFEFLSVCHYHDNWIRNGIYAEAEPGEGVFFEFEIEREMEVFISVHQKLPIFMDKSPEYGISPVEIILAENTPDGLKGIAYGEKDALLGKPTVYATDKVKLKLSEGKYVIRVKIRWVDDEAHEFKISTFSPHPIEIKRAEDEDDYENFLEDIYMDAGKNHPGNFELGHKCKFGSGWSGPYFWIYAANDGKTLWNIEILFEKKENLKVCNLYRKADDTLELIVPPGKKVVAYARRLNGKPVEMKWKLEQTWEEISAE